MKLTAFIAGALAILIALGLAVHYLNTHDLTADLGEAEQYSRYVQGTYVTQSQRPGDLVPCATPADAPAFAKDWQWYCPKAK